MKPRKKSKQRRLFKTLELKQSDFLRQTIASESPSASPQSKPSDSVQSPPAEFKGVRSETKSIPRCQKTTSLSAKPLRRETKRVPRYQAGSPTRALPKMGSKRSKPRSKGIRYGFYKQYSYFDIPDPEVLSLSNIAALRVHLDRSRQEHKKVLMSLPGDFHLPSNCQQAFFDLFTSSAAPQCVFIPKEATQWEGEWENLLAQNLPATDETKALQWAHNKIPPSKIRIYHHGNLIYLRCAGQVGSEYLATLSRDIESSLQSLSLQGELALPPSATTQDGITTWRYLNDAVVIDVSRIFVLTTDFFTTIREILRRRHLTPFSPGVYFVTASLFQSWWLKKGLGVSQIRELGNIIRVVPDKEVSFDHIIQMEVKNIAKVGMRQKPPQALLVHQVRGVAQTMTAMRIFFPEFVLCDEMGTARQIREHLPKAQKSKIFHMTPATDPNLMILGPTLITQGYDMKLFAEYILSQYHNRRGRPNETFFYYFDTQPVNFHKVIFIFRMEFAHVLGEHHLQVLDHFERLETAPDKQGYFVIAINDENILNFDIKLAFTEKGCRQLLAEYSQSFPTHTHEFCAPLHQFLKAQNAATQVEANFHFVQNYNEITVKQSRFFIDLRLRPKRSIITLRSLPEDKLKKRTLQLFKLLLATDTFNYLPDKHIVTTLISFLWKNFTLGEHREDHGFLFTLISSQDKAKLKIFENQHNRALLHQKVEPDYSYFQLAGEIPYHGKQTCKWLEKLGALFYPPEDSQSWQQACALALSIVTAGPQSQSLRFNFRIKGASWTAIFIAKAPPQQTDSVDLKVIRQGTDRLELSKDGRQILLARNPLEEQDEFLESAGELILIELDQVEENAMLQEVDEVMTHEVEQAQRSKRLRRAYTRALEKLDIQAVRAENSSTAVSPEITAPSTHQVLRGQHNTLLDRQLKQVLRYVAIILIIICFGGMSVVMLYVKRIKSSAPKKVPLQAPKFVSAAVHSKSKKVNDASQKTSNIMAQHFIQDVLQRLHYPQPPSQLHLNAILKHIYFKAGHYLQSAYAGDLYNIQGRLYFYKVVLDRETALFARPCKQAWLAEAQKLFQKALAAYSRPGAKTCFKMLLMPWMPEKKWSKVPVGVSYPSIQQAQQDMLTWLKLVKREIHGG